MSQCWLWIETNLTRETKQHKPSATRPRSRRTSSFRSTEGTIRSLSIPSSVEFSSKLYEAWIPGKKIYLTKRTLLIFSSIAMHMSRHRRSNMSACSFSSADICNLRSLPPAFLGLSRIDFFHDQLTKVPNTIRSLLKIPLSPDLDQETDPVIRPQSPRRDVQNLSP